MRGFSTPFEYIRSRFTCVKADLRVAGQRPGAGRLSFQSKFGIGTPDVVRIDLSRI